MPTNQAISEYFDALDSKVDFLRGLKENGHEDEALLLCCAYLDALAELRYFDEPSEGSQKNFVTLLTDHAGDIRLGMIHPLQLLYALKKSRSKWDPETFKKVESLLQSSVGSLFEDDEILARLSKYLTAGQEGKVRANFFKGTLASIIYTRVRCDLVHGISPSPSPHCINLSTTKHNGQPIGSLDFSFVHPLLIAIVESLRKLSVDSGKMFGHGFRGENPPDDDDHPPPEDDQATEDEQDTATDG